MIIINKVETKYRKFKFSLEKNQIKLVLKMQEVRNALDKLVCCITKIVEIVIKENDSLHSPSK